MDGKAQLIVSAVRHFVISKRDISDREIKEVTGKASLFVSLDSNMRLGIELLGDAPGDAVQLHAVEFGFAHALWKEAKKIAHAARRL